jgi:serine/threonine-protein kinase
MHMENGRQAPTIGSKTEVGFKAGVVIDGRYVLQRPLGAGGMGQVWLANEPGLGRQVAIKVISGEAVQSADFRARFREEARLLASAKHPGIVDVISNGDVDGMCYYVMEQLNGRDLGDVLRTKPLMRLPIPTAVSYAIEVAKAMGYVHRCGLIHRDLKPENIFLHTNAGGEMRLKVIDFGLGKRVSGLEGHSTEDERRKRTATSIFFGTPSYMSPEQGESARDVGEPTDIYALACILYEMVVGHPPYDDPSNALGDLEILVRHKTMDIPSAREQNPDVPRWLDKVIKRGMEKLPEDRFPSMEVFCEELERGLEMEERLTAPLQTPRERTVPVWLLALVAAVGIGLLVIFLARVFRGSRRPTVTESGSAHAMLSSPHPETPSHMAVASPRGTDPAPTRIFVPDSDVAVIEPQNTTMPPTKILPTPVESLLPGRHRRHHRHEAGGSAPEGPAVPSVLTPTPPTPEPAVPCGQPNSQGVLIPCFR